MRLALVVAAALSAAQPATAQQSAQPIVSEVFEAAGLDHAALTRRATVCLGKHASAAHLTSDTIITSDPESGVVVARTALAFPSSLGGSATGRSQITVEAKGGRFRITHDKIEHLVGSGWSNAPVPTGLKGTLQSLSYVVADCVQKGPVSDDF